MAEAIRFRNGNGYGSMQNHPPEEGLIALSVAAEHWRLHADAIPVIEALFQSAPQFGGRADCTVTMLRGDLRYSAAGKAFRAEDWATAIALTAEAAGSIGAWTIQTKRGTACSVFMTSLIETDFMGARW